MTPKLVANILTMPAIVLLDPLPFTRVGWSTDQDQQKDVARSKLKIVRDNAPNTEEPQSHRIESWAAQQRPLSTAAAHPEYKFACWRWDGRWEYCVAPIPARTPNT